MAISALVRRDIATQISQSKLVKKRASTDLPMHSLSRYSQIRVATQYMYICIEETNVVLYHVNGKCYEVAFIYRCIMYLVLHQL